jgi:hypothetical protein
MNGFQRTTDYSARDKNHHQHADYAERWKKPMITYYYAHTTFKYGNATILVTTFGETMKTMGMLS